MLEHRRILVLEDDPLPALDLAQTFVDANGRVIGPFNSVAQTLTVLAVELPDAAILDVRLIDRDVTPVAQALLRKGAAVVFHAATDAPLPRSAPNSVRRPSRESRRSRPWSSIRWPRSSKKRPGPGASFPDCPRATGLQTSAH